jgi:hypothetical protein
MKSFDRRSFGKLLLGAIPAVFLAGKAAAEPKQKTRIWVEHTYACGHSLTYPSPGMADPAGILFFMAQDGDLELRPSGELYAIQTFDPCPACRKKQIESGVVDIHPYDLRGMLTDTGANGVSDFTKNRREDSPNPDITIGGFRYRMTTEVPPKTEYGKKLLALRGEPSLKYKVI